MREKDLEAKFVKACQDAGFLTRKLRWVAHRGAPDRIVMGTQGNGKTFVVFVEMKAPGERLQDYQAREHERMRAHGAKVFTIQTEDGVGLFIKLLLSP